MADLDLVLDLDLALAPGSLPPGETRLGTVRVEGSGAATAGYFYADASLPLLVTEDARLIQAQDDEVMDSVRKLEVYRLERRAAEAAGRGEIAAKPLAVRQSRTASARAQNPCRADRRACPRRVGGSPGPCDSYQRSYTLSDFEYSTECPP